MNKHTDTQLADEHINRYKFNDDQVNKNKTDTNLMMIK